MGFYREERVPNHSRFDLAYSCVGRYVGWTKLHSHVFGLIPSLERVHTSISISKKFKLRAPAVHGVSSQRINTKGGVHFIEKSYPMLVKRIKNKEGGFMDLG